jgi:voltage-gated potassium channel
MRYKLQHLLNSKAIETTVLILIAWSVITYLIEVDIQGSVNSVSGNLFFLWSERIVAVIFTIEYLLRWYASPDRRKYPFTVWSLIDLVAIIPFYLGFFIDAEYLGFIRSLRMLRPLKYIRYNKQMVRLVQALMTTWNELAVVGYLVFVVMLVGSVSMNAIEKDAQPEQFGSIANSAWWMWVTLTTVGYGDVSPVTPLGKCVAAVIMLFGLGMVAGTIGIIANVIGHVLNPLDTMPEHIRNGMPSSDRKEEV